MSDLNPATVVKANAVMSAFNIAAGQLTADKNGLNFLKATGPGYISIDWSGVKKISVQVILGVYWRGIYVETNQGEFQFITTKTRELVRTISKYIDDDKIVRRKAPWERK